MGASESYVVPDAVVDQGVVFGRALFRINLSGFVTALTTLTE